MSEDVRPQPLSKTPGVASPNPNAFRKIGGLFVPEGQRRLARDEVPGTRRPPHWVP